MSKRQRVFVLVMALVMVFSLGVQMAVVPAEASGHVDPPPSSQVFDVTTNVDAWERGSFPLRVDMNPPSGFDGPQWTVPNALWELEDNNDNTKDLGKADLGVFEQGDTIRIDFDQSRAGSGTFDDENTKVTLIAAHLKPGVDVTKARTFSGALDLITPSAANKNATFENVTAKKLNDDGEASFQHKVTKSGHYVYFLATQESGKKGFEVNSGKISVDGKVTVIGVDHAAVEEDEAQISPRTRTIVKGQTARFTVSKPGTSAPGDVTHVLAMYHEEKVINADFKLEATAPVTRSFDIEKDAVLHHSIKEVNGVADLEDDVSALGVDLNDGKVSKTVGVETIMDFVAEKADFVRPISQPDNERLDASIHGFKGPAAAGTQITIETFGNWSTAGGSDNYRWIYLAVSDDDSTVLATDTGRVTLRATPPSTPSPPSPGGGGGGGPPAAVGPPQTVPSIPDAQPTRTEQAGFRDDDPEQPGVNIRFTQGIVDEITFSGEDEPGGQIEVQELDRGPTPEEVSDGEEVESVVRAIRINVPAGQSSRGASIRFRLSQAEIGDRDPGNVRLALLTDEGWQFLGTTPVDPTADPVQFTARTPHFSDFAIVFVRPQVATPTPSPVTATPVPTTAAATATPAETTAPPEATATETQPAPASPPEAAPPEEPAGMDPVTIVLIIVVLAVLAAAGYVLYRRRELE